MTESQKDLLIQAQATALEEINAICVNYLMVKGRDFGRAEGEQILTILERWCEAEDAIK